MKRTATVCIIAFLLMTPVIAEESKGKSATTYTVETNTYTVHGNAYAHPVSIDPKQVVRILSSLRYLSHFDRAIPIFNSEERIQLATRICEIFAALGSDQQVMIQRKSSLPGKDSPEPGEKIETVYLCFLDKDTLYAAYLTSGIQHGNSLAIGNYMAPFQLKDGSNAPNIALLLRPMWTTNADSPVFEKDFESALSTIQSMKSSENSTSIQSQEKVTSEPMLSVNELEAGLEKLQSLLDKKLITREEYESLRKDLMKRAGIGGGR